MNEFWDEFYWEDLSAGEEKFWADLGWDLEGWDDDEGEVPADDKDWEESSEKEQAALANLGYDEEYWDA